MSETETAGPGGESAEPKLPSYWDYLRVEELLSLQGGLGEDDSELSNHELLFIVVHQVYELWFKLVLRELETVRDAIARDPVPDQELSLAVAGLRRVREILDRAVDHFRVMETLTTRDFLDFRDRLVPASGFQSGQMREMEILLGLEESQRLHLGVEGSYLTALESADGSPSPSLARVMRRRESGPSLREAVANWLERTPIRGKAPGDAGADEALDAFVDDFVKAQATELAAQAEGAGRQAATQEGQAAIRRRFESEAQNAEAFLRAFDVAEEDRARTMRVRAALLFIESYRELPLLSWPREFLDALIGLEQAFVLFRHRHARMVEREIGRRTGTGGSAGVDYLDATAQRYRVFRDVWAVRTLLLRRGAVPPLEEGEFYGFRHGAT